MLPASGTHRGKGGEVTAYKFRLRRKKARKSHAKKKTKAKLAKKRGR